MTSSVFIEKICSIVKIVIQSCFLFQIRLVTELACHAISPFLSRCKILKITDELN